MNLVLNRASFTDKARKPQPPHLLPTEKEVVRGEMESCNQSGEVEQWEGQDWALNGEKCSWHLSQATRLGPGGDEILAETTWLSNKTAQY
jgi:hypothetical protein